MTTLNPLLNIATVTPNPGTRGWVGDCLWTSCGVLSDIRFLWPMVRVPVEETAGSQKYWIINSEMSGFGRVRAQDAKPGSKRITDCCPNNDRRASPHRFFLSSDHVHSPSCRGGKLTGSIFQSPNHVLVPRKFLLDSPRYLTASTSESARTHNI
jgi:hypothetical protein